MMKRKFVKGSAYDFHLGLAITWMVNSFLCSDLSTEYSIISLAFSVSAEGFFLHIIYKNHNKMSLIDRKEVGLACWQTTKKFVTAPSRI